MIEVSASGRLYITGEYIIVETSHPAVIAAVNQFMTVTVESARKVGSIQSTQYSGTPVRWTRRNGELVLDIRENPFHYTLTVIRLTEKYAQEKNILLSFYDLKITSELDSSNGRRYGLGSSDAVTVTAVKALNVFYALNLSQLEVFKITALTNLAVQDSGSRGDIVASCYGGQIAFSIFDHPWLQEQETQHSISELLALDRPGLSIELLITPGSLRLLIGWTGSLASTSDLVDQVHRSREDKMVAYQLFLENNTECVNEMIKGLKENNVTLIQQMIRKNRQLLHDLSAITGVVIETPALNKLCNLAGQYERAAKSSGADGGDYGIVVVDRKSGILPLMSAQGKAEITPLPLHVYSDQRKENQ